MRQVVSEIQMNRFITNPFLLPGIKCIFFFLYSFTWLPIGRVFSDVFDLGKNVSVKLLFSNRG